MLSIACAVALAVGSLDPTEVEQARILQVELTRFPSFEVAEAWVNFGRTHRMWLESQGAVCHEINDIIEFIVPWHLLKEAQNPSLPIATRFDALKELDEWGLFGEMPAPPLQHFKDGPPPPWKQSIVLPNSAA
jgi:hypothetical protein